MIINKILGVLIVVLFLIWLFDSVIAPLFKKENRVAVIKKIGDVLNEFKIECKSFIQQFQRGYFHVLRLLSIFRFFKTCINYPAVFLATLIIGREIIHTNAFTYMAEKYPDILIGIINNIDALINVMFIIFIVALGLGWTCEDKLQLCRFSKLLVKLFVWKFVIYFISLILLEKINFKLTTNTGLVILFSLFILYVFLNAMISFISNNIFIHIHFVKPRDNKVVFKLDDCLQGLLIQTESNIIHKANSEELIVRGTFRVSYSLATVSCGFTTSLPLIGKAIESQESK